MPKIDAILAELRKRAAQGTPPEPPPAPPSDPNADRWKHRLMGSGVQKTDAEESARVMREHGGGVYVARLIRAAAYAQIRYKDSSPEAVHRVVRDVYRDLPLATVLEKALSAGTPEQGGYLIPTMLGEDLIELLYPATVLGKLGATSLPMPAGNLTLPALSQGSAAAYQGENADTRATEPRFGERSWRAKKLMAIIPISNDLLRSSSPRADAVVQRDAVKALAVTMDLKGLIGTGSQDEPRGIVHTPGITPVTVGTVVDADTPVQFLEALLEANVDLDQAARLGWAFNQKIWADYFNLKSTATGHYLLRDEMKGGTILGHPFAISQQIPTGTGTGKPTYQIFGDWSEVYIPSMGEMEVATSDSAAYVDSTGAVRAAFAKDQTLIRLIDRHDIGLRQPSKMAVSSDTMTE